MKMTEFIIYQCILKFLSAISAGFFSSARMLITSALPFFTKTFCTFSKIVFLFDICKTFAKQTFSSILAWTNSFLPNH